LSGSLPASYKAGEGSDFEPVLLLYCICISPLSNLNVFMRVLVIDDSRDAAHLVSILVQHFGHETKVVTVTKVAVDIARD
jgi:hypothetical protein